MFRDWASVSSSFSCEVVLPSLVVGRGRGRDPGCHRPPREKERREGRGPLPSPLALPPPRERHTRPQPQGRGLSTAMEARTARAALLLLALCGACTLANGKFLAFKLRLGKGAGSMVRFGARPTQGTVFVDCGASGEGVFRRSSVLIRTARTRALRDTSSGETVCVDRSRGGAAVLGGGVRKVKNDKTGKSSLDGDSFVSLTYMRVQNLC